MTPNAIIDEQRAPRAAIFLTASLLALSLSAGPSYADKRSPAPIVFAGQGGERVATRPASTQAPKKQTRRERRAARKAAKRATAPLAAPTKRVEFRYPDQPDVFYGADGPRADADAAPLSFSSSTAAISQAEAAKLTVGDSPQITQPKAAAPVLASVARDPAITPGGFDARAAAARSAQKPAVQLYSAAGTADFSANEVKSAPLPALDVQPSAAAPKVETRPVSGTVFQPNPAAVYDETGSATVFDPVLNGQPTSTGEILDTQAMVAAHPSLPLPSLVQVINLQNDREVVVRVNDRGPIGGEGILEVSDRAAEVLGFAQTGASNVRVRYLGPAPQFDAAKAPAQPIAQAPRPVHPNTALFKTAAPAPKPVRTVQTASPSGDAAMFVQLGSFSDISNAQRMYTSLTGRLKNVEIMPVSINGTDYFRVVAGPVASRHDAERLRDNIANQGIARGLVIAAP